MLDLKLIVSFLESKARCEHLLLKKFQWNDISSLNQSESVISECWKKRILQVTIGNRSELKSVQNWLQVKHTCLLKLILNEIQFSVCLSVCCSLWGMCSSCGLHGSLCCTSGEMVGTKWNVALLLDYALLTPVPYFGPATPCMTFVTPRIVSHFRRGSFAILLFCPANPWGRLWHPRGSRLYLPAGAITTIR